MANRELSRRGNAHGVASARSINRAGGMPIVSNEKAEKRNVRLNHLISRRVKCICSAREVVWRVLARPSEKEAGNVVGSPTRCRKSNRYLIAREAMTA